MNLNTKPPPSMESNQIKSVIWGWKTLISSLLKNGQICPSCHILPSLHLSSSHSCLVLPNTWEGFYCFSLQVHLHSTVNRRDPWIPSTLFASVFLFFFWPRIATALKSPNPLQLVLSKRNFRLLPTSCLVLLLKMPKYVRLSWNKSLFPPFLEHTCNLHLFKFTLGHTLKWKVRFLKK